MFPMPTTPHPMLERARTVPPTPHGPGRPDATLEQVIGRGIVVVLFTIGLARFAVMPIESLVLRVGTGPRPELVGHRIVPERSRFVPSSDDGAVVLEVTDATRARVVDGVGCVPVAVRFEPWEVDWFIGNERVDIEPGRLNPVFTKADLLRRGVPLGGRVVVRVAVTYRVSWQSAFGVEGRLDPVVRSADHVILVE